MFYLRSLLREVTEDLEMFGVFKISFATLFRIFWSPSYRFKKAISLSLIAIKLRYFSSSPLLRLVVNAFGVLPFLGIVGKVGTSCAFEARYDWAEKLAKDLVFALEDRVLLAVARSPELYTRSSVANLEYIPFRIDEGTSIIEQRYLT